MDRGELETGKSIEIQLPPRTPRSADAINADDRKLFSLSGVGVAIFSGFWSQGLRRLGADRNGDTVWICNYWSGNLAKFDTYTLKPTYYKYPTVEAGVYDAAVDKGHNVWVNLLNSDAVAKFDSKTERWTEFPLPSRGTETRHIALMERNGKTEITLGYTRTSTVARMEVRTPEDLQALKMQAQDNGCSFESLRDV